MNKLALDDLLGSLQTYEIVLDTQSNDKGIALKVEVITPNTTPYFEDKIMMLTQNFKKFLRKAGETLRSQGGCKSENRDRTVDDKPRYRREKGSSVEA